MRRALVFILLLPSAAEARESPGTTAAPVLQLPVGARAAGMGSAFAAVADDVSALHYNPGGLSMLGASELSFMYLKGFAGNNLEHIAAATPLPFGGLIGSGHTTVAASVLFAQNGRIEVTRTAPNGSLLGAEEISAGGDLVATLGYAERVFDWEVESRRENYHFIHAMGVSGKFIRSTLAEEFAATTVAGDLGYLVRSPELGTSFGASVHNFGGKLRFVDEGDPLPLTIRAGAGYEPALPETLALPPEQTLRFASDIEYLTQEAQWHVNAGLEYTALRSYALRLGYQFERDLAGLTAGFGVEWRGVRMDYAWAMTSELADAHRFSFSYRFGRIPGYQRDFRRRPFIESMPEREDLQDLEERRPEPLEPSRPPRRTIPDEKRTAPGWIY